MEEIKDYWELATPMNFADERWSYEKKRDFRYSLQNYMHDAIGFQDWKDKKVLDFGCGSGIDTLEFAQNGAEVTAVDITSNAVALTKALSEEAKIPVEVTQIRDVLPYHDSVFDLVYSFGVLHHIPKVEDTLAEIHRVLKPNGSIIAMLYNKDSLLYAYSIVYLRGLKDKLSLDGFSNATMDKLVSQYSERNEGCPHTKAYTKTEAKNLFEQYFSNVNVSVHYNVLDLPTQRKVKLGIGDEFELGWHLIIKGRR